MQAAVSWQGERHAHTQAQEGGKAIPTTTRGCVRQAGLGRGGQGRAGHAGHGIAWQACTAGRAGWLLVACGWLATQGENQTFGWAVGARDTVEPSKAQARVM